jgi:tetratricopeptide (TPR) repeat protein
MRPVAATVAVALVLGVAPAADAAPPGRWAAARMSPSARAEAAALERADAQLLAGRRLRRIAAEVDPLRAGGLLVHQQAALRILQAAGGARAASPALRLRYGEVLADLGEHREAAAVLETVVDVAPVHLRVDAWVELAVEYARLGRARDEIGCYDRALAFEPHAPTRATILANQAEATMTTGDVDRAVAGYRAALGTIEQLSAQEVQVYAPTTLWGLAVALDRAGQVDAALDAVQRARSYDPLDSRLAGDGWFFNPPHDEAWYAGLGHLAVARRGPEPDVRLAAYGRAIESFREYVERAPEGDPWAASARARVASLLSERARYEKRVRTPLPVARRLPPSR